MANVNSIRCCGFTKAYKVLTDSRKGCLSDCELYKNALLQYQIAALAEYSSEGCLTQEQYDSLYQKLKLNCNCCSPDIELENPGTEQTDLCFFYATFSDDNYFEGWEIDNQPFTANVNTVMNSYGGRGDVYNDDGNPIGAIITYMGSASSTPPNPLVEDTNVPVPYTWSTPICETSCWQHEFIKPDFIMSSINLGFTPAINFLQTLTQNINVSIPADIVLLQTFLQGIYGPQVQVQSVQQPSTNYLVTITGVYIDPLTSVTGTTTIVGAFGWENIVCE